MMKMMLMKLKLKNVSSFPISSFASNEGLSLSLSLSPPISLNGSGSSSWGRLEKGRGDMGRTWGVMCMCNVYVVLACCLLVY